MNREMDGEEQCSVHSTQRKETVDTMSQLLSTAFAAVGRFVLAWLFAAWLYWNLSLLSLPWPSWVSVATAALIGFMLQTSAKPVLEKFCRFDEVNATPGNVNRPDVMLRGLGKLFELYLVTAVISSVGYLVSPYFLRTSLFATIDGVTTPTELIELLATLIGFFVGLITYFLGKWFYFRQPSSILRGRRVRSLKEAKKQLKPHCESNEPEITWGGVGLPWSAGPRHFVAAGMTGSGKTNVLLQFMASVLIWIGRKSDQRALIYDPKTELVSFLYGLGLGSKVRILHPLDIRSCAWDLAADVNSPTTAQQMAAVFIPDDKDSKNPFFGKAAQQVLAGVFTFLTKTAPGKWDLRDVIFIMERHDLLRQVLESYPDTAALVEEYFQPADTFANVRSTIANWMRSYRPIAACWHRAAEKVSLEDWIKGEYILLLGQDDSIRVQMDAINRAIFVRATQLILRGSDNTNRRSWLIVDEVRELGDLNGLSRFLTTARSKGACFCGGYQTPSGMKAAVGDHIADEINDNIWSWALFRMGGDVSAEWASKKVGDVEFEEQTQGSTNIVTRRALLPEYFMELPPPTPQTGVAGVFVTPYTGAYRHSVPGSEIAKARRIARPDVPNFVARPTEHQDLQHWTEEDYRRLNLRAVRVHTSGHRNQAFDPSRLRVLRSGAQQ